LCRLLPPGGLHLGVGPSLVVRRSAIECSEFGCQTGRPYNLPSRAVKPGVASCWLVSSGSPSKTARCVSHPENSSDRHHAKIQFCSHGLSACTNDSLDSHRAARQMGGNKVFAVGQGRKVVGPGKRYLTQPTVLKAVRFLNSPSRRSLMKSTRWTE